MSESDSQVTLHIVDETTLAERLEGCQRDIRAMRVLLDFFITAAPHLTTHYYPSGKVTGAKHAQTIVNGQVVAEGFIGGKVEARSFQTDLYDAVAEANRIMAEK